MINQVLMAADPLIGSYAGLVASAIFGCTLVFTIPVGMGMIRQRIFCGTPVNGLQSSYALRRNEFQK